MIVWFLGLLGLPSNTAIDSEYLSMNANLSAAHALN